MKEENASDDLQPIIMDINTNSNNERENSVNDITVVQEAAVNKNEGNSAGALEITQASVKANTDTKMLPIPFYKSIPAAIIVVLLIWKPLFVVLFQVGSIRATFRVSSCSKDVLEGQHRRCLSSVY